MEDIFSVFGIFCVVLWLTIGTMAIFDIAKQRPWEVSVGVGRYNDDLEYEKAIRCERPVFKEADR